MKEEDYPIYLVMKGRESDEAIAIIEMEKRDDDRYASVAIKDMYNRVYKYEQISEAQFETYELFGIPSTLPMDMTFLLLESAYESDRHPEAVQERIDNLHQRWSKWGS